MLTDKKQNNHYQTGIELKIFTNDRIGQLYKDNIIIHRSSGFLTFARPTRFLN